MSIAPPVDYPLPDPYEQSFLCEHCGELIDPGHSLMVYPGRYVHKRCVEDYAIATTEELFATRRRLHQLAVKVTRGM